jgi:hypothetical protein
LGASLRLNATAMGVTMTGVTEIRSYGDTGLPRYQPTK